MPKRPSFDSPALAGSLRMSSRGTPQAVVVLITCPTRRVAERLAQALVRQRAAACVNLLPGLQSVFRWEGKIDHAREVLLLIKTTPARVARLTRLVRSLHPYEVPEVIALPVTAGSAPYLRWVKASVSPAP